MGRTSRVLPREPCAPARELGRSRERDDGSAGLSRGRVVAKCSATKGRTDEAEAAPSFRGGGGGRRASSPPGRRRERSGRDDGATRQGTATREHAPRAPARGAEQGRRGRRRDDRRTARGVPSGTVAAHPRGGAQRRVPTPTRAEGGDPEAGRGRDADAGNTDGARTTTSASPTPATASYLRPDLLGRQLRLPTRAGNASRARANSRAYCDGEAVGGGSGSREILRPSEPRRLDGARGEAGEGQASAALDSPLLAGGDDGGRACVAARGRNATRWSPVPAVEQYSARRAGQGTRTTRAPIRPVRRRLQCVRADA